MTVPSSIFALAQLEVMNARADLAGRMQGFVSLHWMLSKIFGLDDDEIQLIMDQRSEDIIRDGKANGAAQAAMMPQDPAAMGGAPGAEGEPAPEDEDPMGFDQDAEEIPESVGNNRRQFNRLHVRKSGGITERQLMTGDRDAEKRAEAKLEALLKNDKAFAHRLNELSGMLNEIRAAARKR
jgi:hypothetical protein